MYRELGNGARETRCAGRRAGAGRIRGIFRLCRTGRGGPGQPAQSQATATAAATPAASTQQGNGNNGQGKAQAVANQAWLGVSVQSADGGGAKVVEVVKGSPAATEGIAKDDVVKTFNGQDVKDASGFDRGGNGG